MQNVHICQPSAQQPKRRLFARGAFLGTGTYRTAFDPSLVDLAHVQFGQELLRQALPDPPFVAARLAAPPVILQKLPVDVLDQVAVAVGPPLDLPHMLGAGHADVQHRVDLAVRVVPQARHQAPDHFVVDADRRRAHQNMDPRQGRGRTGSLVGRVLHPVDWEMLGQ